MIIYHCFYVSGFRAVAVHRQEIQITNLTLRSKHIGNLMIIYKMIKTNNRLILKIMKAGRTIQAESI